MYPKIIWQDIVSVRGYDRVFRVVQTSDDDAIVEWSKERDAMGVCSWEEFGNDPHAGWYNTLVADLMRKAIADPYVRTETCVADKIALIKLVRIATKRHDYNHDGNVMGLKDAKDLVEQWLAAGGRIES